MKNKQKIKLLKVLAFPATAAFMMGVGTTAIMAEDDVEQTSIIQAETSTQTEETSSISLQGDAQFNESQNEMEITDTVSNQSKEDPGQLPAEQESPQKAKQAVYGSQPIKKYQVKINYIDESGNAIAASYYTIGKNGESWSHASPTIEGFDLKNASQKVMNGIFQGSDIYKEYSVIYKSALAYYTVLWQKRDYDGNYQLIDTEIRKGPINHIVTVAPKEIDHYHCVSSENERQVKINENGSSIITMKYDPDITNYSIYYETNGSYVPAQTGKPGDSIEKRESPTKIGYDFAGWDIDDDGQVDVLPEQLQEKGIVAKAVWNPAKVNYQVNYYGQEKSDKGTYHLIYRTELQGKTDDWTQIAPSLSEVDAQDEIVKYYQYAKEDEAQQIKADGTTVINVYYDWKPVTVHIVLWERDKDIEDSTNIIEPYTQRLYSAVQLPNEDEFFNWYKKTYNTDKWHLDYWGYGTVKSLGDRNSTIKKNTKPLLSTVYLTELPDHSLSAYFVAVVNDLVAPSYYYESLYEDANGEYPENGFSTYTLKGYYEGFPEELQTARFNVYVHRNGYHFAGYQLSTNRWDGKDIHSIQWTDWKEPADGTTYDAFRDCYVVPEQRMNILKANVWQVKYERDSYTMNFYLNGSSLYRSMNQKWGTVYDFKDLIPDASDGYVFSGWYTDENYTGDSITSLIMPIGGTNLYAKFVHPDVKLTFDSQGGSAVESQMVKYSTKGIRPEDPTRDGYTFIGWYYYGKEAEDPAYFSFDRILESNTNLVAMWKSKPIKTSYTVIHKTKDGKILHQETINDVLINDTVTVRNLDLNDSKRQGYKYVDASARTMKFTSDPMRNVLTFVYSNEPIHTYCVHYMDKETGKPLAEDLRFDSLNILEYVRALNMNGYTVFGEDTAYLDAENNNEYTFYYVKNKLNENETVEKKRPEQSQDVISVHVDQQISDYQTNSNASIPDTGVETQGLIWMLLSSITSIGIFGAAGNRRKRK